MSSLSSFKNNSDRGQNLSDLRAAELVRPLEGGFLCASFKIQNSKFKIPSAFVQFMCLKPYKKHTRNWQRRTISSHSGRRKGRRIRCYQYIVPLGQRNLRNKVSPEVGNQLVADSFNKSNLRGNLSDLWRADSSVFHSKFKIQNSKFKIPSAFAFVPTGIIYR